MCAIVLLLTLAAGDPIQIEVGGFDTQEQAQEALEARVRVFWPPGHSYPVVGHVRCLVEQ